MRESLLFDFLKVDGESANLAAERLFDQYRMFEGEMPYNLAVALTFLGVEKARRTISSFSTSVKRALALPMVDGGVYTTKWVEGEFNTTQKSLLKVTSF